MKRRIYISIIVILIMIGSFLIYHVNQNKNEIRLTDSAGKEVIYNPDGRNALIFSSECENCRYQLRQLAKQSAAVQSEFDLISISDVEETNELIQYFKIKSNVYFDTYKDFSKKFDAAQVPAIFNFKDDEVVRNDDYIISLKQ